MIYLREELLSKAKSDGKPSASAGAGKAESALSGGRGEQRGGKYVARIEVGYEKDGSPKYRYFKTEEDYEKYMKGRGVSKEAQKLENKVKREHAESTSAATGRVVHQPASKKEEPGLLSPVRKSLYVRI
jgi:hypothetical protein